MYKQLQLYGGIHPRQYGFTRGKSTEDAIEAMLQHGRMFAATYKYVVSIFVDIKGSFDHAWWLGIRT